VTFDIAVSTPPVIASAAVPPHSTSMRRALLRHAVGVVSAIVIVLLAVGAVAAPHIAPYSPTAQDAPRIEDPSTAHPFGTDQLGRDVLSRVLHGARVSLGVGVIAVALGAAFGVCAGLAAGYAGGLQDRAGQLLLDIGLAFPGIVALMVVVAAFGRSLTIVTVAIAATAVPTVMRVVRGSVLREKESPYVEAARALGASTPRIIVRHILPNIAAVIIVLVSALIPAAILSEATLSFFGFGAEPPTPSWGGDLSSQDARSFFEYQPWMAIAPGAALSITVLAFNLLGDTLRDVLDPRMRGGRP
jgi:peptide/nickel transport system permease protein